MKEETREIFSEVYHILILLGEKYINKLPKKLFEDVKNNRLPNYYIYDILDEDIVLKKVKKQSLSMIALFHLNYWCDDTTEKEILKQILKENEKKNIEEIQKSNEYNELFKNKHEIKSAKNQIAKINKKGLLSIIISQIKKFLKRK